MAGKKWGRSRSGMVQLKGLGGAALALALVAPAATASRAAAVAEAPIIGGRGNWTFEYVPSRLAFPPGSSCATDGNSDGDGGGCNCHGLVVDRDGRIYLTYEPDHHRRAGAGGAGDGDGPGPIDKIDDDDAPHCMVRFESDGTGGVSYGSAELCGGTPHGLTLVVEEESEGKEEDGEEDGMGIIEYLYHANNAAAVHKTTLNGTIVWSNTRRPPQYDDDMEYKPTWVAVPPGSPNYVYVADGYGSQYVHVLNDTDGRFVGRMYGGRGSDPGTFSTCHGMNVDTRPSRQRRRHGDDDDDEEQHLVIVSDRENHRHQYFRSRSSSRPSSSTTHYDEKDEEFVYDSEFTVPGLDRVCHFRPTPDGTGHAVIPALEGPVGIVNRDNELVSLIDVAGLLGDRGHLHPHDAIVLPVSGDMVVATWNPGRVSYWRRVRVSPPPPVVHPGDGVSLA